MHSGYGLRECHMSHRQKIMTLVSMASILSQTFDVSIRRDAEHVTDLQSQIHSQLVNNTTTRVLFEYSHLSGQTFNSITGVASGRMLSALVRVGVNIWLNDLCLEMFEVIRYR